MKTPPPKHIVFLGLGSLCAIDELERKALEHALLIVRDTSAAASLIKTTSLHPAIPVPEAIREWMQSNTAEKDRADVLVRYLASLDHLLDDARLSLTDAAHEIFETVFPASRNRILLSEYPLLTTNIARAASLGGRATKLGRILPADTSGGADGNLCQRLEGLEECVGLSWPDTLVVTAHPHLAHVAEALGSRVEHVESLLPDLPERAPINAPIGSVAIRTTTTRDGHPH